MPCCQFRKLSSASGSSLCAAASVAAQASRLASSAPQTALDPSKTLGVAQNWSNCRCYESSMQHQPCPVKVCHREARKHSVVASVNIKHHEYDPRQVQTVLCSSGWATLPD